MLGKWIGTVSVIGSLMSVALTLAGVTIIGHEIGSFLQGDSAHFQWGGVVLNLGVGLGLATWFLMDKYLNCEKPDFDGREKPGIGSTFDRDFDVVTGPNSARSQRGSR